MDFIEEYKNWIKKGKITDAPDIFLELSALHILSMNLKRTFYINWGQKRLFPNLWSILIAKSSIYRKSTCLDLTKKFVSQDDIFPTEYSSELLIKEIAFKKQGIFFIDELISTMKLWGKEYALSAKSILTSLYDCESSYKRKTLTYTYEIENPFINIMSCSVPNYIQNTMKEEDITSGFLPRFLLVYVWEKKDKNIPFPAPGDFEKERTLFKFLEDLKTFRLGFFGKEIPLSFSKIAKKRMIEYASLIEDLIIKEGNGLSCFYTRLLVYALKLSLLYFFSNSKNYIDKDKLIIKKIEVDKAIKLIENIRHRTEKLLSSFAFSRYQSIRLKIIEILENKTEISYSELLRKIKIKTRELKEILETLEDEGSIEILKEEEGKKPTIIKRKEVK